MFLESIGDPTWDSLSRAVFWVISKDKFAKRRLLFKLQDARISENLGKWYNYLKGRVKRVIVNYSN